MIDFNITILLSSVVSGATPIVLATLGETITEKSGVINLSLDGAILLSAMAAFAVAYETQLLLLGFLAAALTGAFLALTVVIFAVYLHQSQVAVGFVLTLMAKDLAYFFGNPYAHIQGPQVLPQSLWGLSRIPFFGKVFFSHNWIVYISIFMIWLIWWYIYRTPSGLNLRSVGENPHAAFARGISPKKQQILCAFIGGMLVGLAGASFSLCIKPGWGHPQGAEGTGWIALALVIFGGWHPVKAALGAYLFSFLQVMGIYLQDWLPSVPTQVFQVAPFPLMIFILVIVALTQKETLLHPGHKKSLRWRIKKILQVQAPAALGKQETIE